MTNALFAWLRRPALWLALGVVAALVVVMARFLPPGPDFQFTHRPVALRFIRGETQLFDGPSIGFYNAPWSLAVIAPLTLFSEAVGQAVLNTVSLLGMVLAIHALREPVRLPAVFVLLALANLHTVDLLLRGNVDALMLAGVGLCWMGFERRNPWLLAPGLWLMSIKPVNVALAGLLFLFAMRSWPWRDWLKALSLLLVSFAASLVLNGPDWPVRYFVSLRQSPPYTFLLATVWRGAEALHVPAALVAVLCGLAVAGWGYAVWRLGLTQLTLHLALATNLVVSPYSLGYHYILLIPAFLYVARRSWPLALLAYAATWTPLIRLRYGFDVTWIDVIYPLLLLAALWWVGWKDGVFYYHYGTKPGDNIPNLEGNND